MNGQPHTHQLVVTNVSSLQWEITYGDQTMKLWHPIFGDPEKTLTKACERIIARHDRASQAAQAEADRARHDAELVARVTLSVQSRIAVETEPCPGGDRYYNHRYCGMCGGTGRKVLNWPSDSLTPAA